MNTPYRPDCWRDLYFVPTSCRESSVVRKEEPHIVFASGLPTSRPQTAKPAVPMTPKTKAATRLVSGPICHKTAPPSAAALTTTSRIRYHCTRTAAILDRAILQTIT